jgi:hypothetical protein
MKYAHSMLVSALLAFTVAGTAPQKVHAHLFGRCSHHQNAEVKIKSCLAATRLTASPTVLHWVYREMARAHRERGEISQAIVGYLHALAARDREAVRQEMEQLLALSH